MLLRATRVDTISDPGGHPSNCSCNHSDEKHRERNRKLNQKQASTTDHNCNDVENAKRQWHSFIHHLVISSWLDDAALYVFGRSNSRKFAGCTDDFSRRICSVTAMATPLVTQRFCHECGSADDYFNPLNLTRLGRAPSSPNRFTLSASYS